MRSKTYQSYPLEVKKAIVASGNIKLFPELRIPRSTAYHWLKHGVRVAELADTLNRSTDPKSTQQNDDAAKNAELAIVLAKILTILFQMLPMSALRKNVQAFKEVKTLVKILNVGDLAKAISKRYANIIFAEAICKSSADGKCLRRQPGQLSANEVAQMKRLVTSKKYSHFSITSLCLYAKRQDIIHCCRDTWYRYINKFSWERPIKKYDIPKRKLVGLRASKPNEIWHMDATIIKTIHGRVFYLQVLVDNFSRLVLAWSVTQKINAKSTAKLIQAALNTHRPKEQVSLISDGGSENVNETVREMLTQHRRPRIIHKLAKHQIDKSNSMAEILFHKLKTNYLNHCALNSRGDIVQNAGFYIHQKNEVMPHQALLGLTPIEAHSGLNPHQFIRRLNEQSAEKRIQRLEVNKMYLCGVCADTSLQRIPSCAESHRFSRP